MILNCHGGKGLGAGESSCGQRMDGVHSSSSPFHCGGPTVVKEAKSCNTWTTRQASGVLYFLADFLEEKRHFYFSSVPTHYLGFTELLNCTVGVLGQCGDNLFVMLLIGVGFQLNESPACRYRLSLHTQSPKCLCLQIETAMVLWSSLSQGLRL